MLIEPIKYFMIITGTWHTDWTKNSRLRTLQLWYRRTTQAILFILLLLVVAKLVQLVSIKADAEVIFACASILFTVLVSVINAFIYEKNNVSRLFLKIIKEEEEISKSTDNDIKKSYHGDIKVAIKLKNGITIATVLGAVVFLIFNCINHIKNNKDVEKTEKELTEESFLYPIWLPYKERENLAYVLVINVIFMFTASNVYISTHILSFMPMIFATAELKIIQVQLRHLGSATYRNCNSYCVLKEIVNKHLFVISFVNDLNKYTKYIMMTNFLFNSVSVASVAIEVLMQETVGELAFPILHLIHLVINVFLVGWFANEIKVQNLALGDALSQTNWYDYDVRTQKLLIVMIRQTQQTLAVSIGPFGSMTLETALKTMQAAYSYITLMKNLK